MKLGRIESVSDRTLNRLLVWGGGALAVCVLAFSVFYYFDQRIDGGPSMAERTIAAAEAAVVETPSDLGVRLQLASAYLLGERLDDAQKQYEEVLGAEENHRAALLGLGTVLYAKGDLDGAIEPFRSIVTTGVEGEFAGADLTLQEAQYYLGSIDLQKGNPAKAIEELQAALAISPTDSDALFLLGKALISEGRAADGVQSIRSAVAFVPTGWCEPYQAMADAYSVLKQQEQQEYAAAMLDFCQERDEQAKSRLTALTEGSAAVDAMVGLGLIAEKQSDRDAAADWYAKALKANPGNASAASGLARASEAGALSHSDTAAAGPAEGSK